MASDATGATSAVAEAKSPLVEATSPTTEGISPLPASRPAPHPVSIGRRMLLCFFWTIFGLLFFYLVMVVLSTIAKEIILEQLEPNGWPRSASRHTAAAAVAPFVFFLLTPPSWISSLFWAVMAACAKFAHFVIIASDLSVYVDANVAHRVFRVDHMHPIFRRLPLYTPHVVGTIAFFSLLVITTERCFFSAMRHRRRYLPFPSLAAAIWVYLVFMLWYTDHLLNVLLTNPTLDNLIYPLSFITPLTIAMYVAARRQSHALAEAAAAAAAAKAELAPSKKTN